MSTPIVPLVKEVGRVTSSQVPLDSQQQKRFEGLIESLVMIDLHQHPFVFPENLDLFAEYLRSGDFRWGYEAMRHGGFSGVATANVLACLLNSHDVSFIRFDDLVSELNQMISDLALHGDIAIKVGNADQIIAAKNSGKLGIFPTVEHLAIGNRIERVDLLYNLGVRLAGMVYNRKNYVGDGLNERNDGGLSDFGIEVLHRMNELGMAADLSHASPQTAMDIIEFSKAPVIFSHNQAYTLRQTKRSRKDEELIACASNGGLIGITAVPNSLSDDPEQDIGCVLDHYDYMIKLVGIDSVGIGTDTTIGDHVGFHKKMMARDAPAVLPAPYLNGLESPADGKNIIRGLIVRGYSDDDIKKVAGGNALAYFRRVMN